MRRSTDPGPTPDGGFTLIEVLVTLALAGILMTLGAGALKGFVLANRQSGTAQQIRSTLSTAGEQALSQGRTYCVYFTATTWATYRSDCTVAANKTSATFQVEDASIQLSAISFPAPSPAIANQNTACPAAGRCAYFYPRGTALAGTLQVSRSGKTYSINVNGLTGRVSVA
jgi:prepilin-type N-terminal cleavage/methylation domain-containing protein